MEADLLAGLSLDTLVQSARPLFLLPSSCPRLTHNLTQNRKKAVESTEKRVWERIGLRMKSLRKAREMSKSNFGAQLIARRPQVQVLSAQPSFVDKLLQASLTKKMQPKVPHFCAGFLHIKSVFCSKTR